MDDLEIARAHAHMAMAFYDEVIRGGHANERALHLASVYLGALVVAEEVGGAIHAIASEIKPDADDGKEPWKG